MTEQMPQAGTREIPAPPRSSGWKLALLGLVILLCGAIIGACCVILIGPRAVVPPPRGQGELGRQVGERIAQILNLSPEQSLKVKQIVQEHTAKIREIQTESHDEMRDEIEAMHQEVMAQLNEEQKRTYQRYVRDWRRLALRGPQPPYRRGPHSGGPGGPLKGPPQPRSGQLFDRLDVDQDGKLTRDELPSRIAEQLMRADQDGDGALTWEEIVRLRPRQPGGKPGEPTRPQPKGPPTQ